MHLKKKCPSWNVFCSYISSLILRLMKLNFKQLCLLLGHCSSSLALQCTYIQTREYLLYRDMWVIFCILTMSVLDLVILAMWWKKKQHNHVKILKKWDLALSQVTDWTQCSGIQNSSSCCLSPQISNSRDMNWIFKLWYIQLLGNLGRKRVTIPERKT